MTSSTINFFSLTVKMKFTTVIALFAAAVSAQSSSGAVPPASSGTVVASGTHGGSSVPVSQGSQGSQGSQSATQGSASHSGPAVSSPTASGPQSGTTGVVPA